MYLPVGVCGCVVKTLTSTLSNFQVFSTISLIVFTCMLSETSQTKTNATCSHLYVEPQSQSHWDRE